MAKKISRIIGMIMLIVAIAFVVFALKHPETSFPWSNTVTYAVNANIKVSHLAGFRS